MKGWNVVWIFSVDGIPGNDYDCEFDAVWKNAKWMGRPGLDSRYVLRTSPFLRRRSRVLAVRGSVE